MSARLFVKVVLFIMVVGFLFALSLPFANAQREEARKKEKVQVYQLPPIIATATRCTDILNALPGLFVHKTGAFRLRYRLLAVFKYSTWALVSSEFTAGRVE